MGRLTCTLRRFAGVAALLLIGACGADRTPIPADGAAAGTPLLVLAAASLNGAMPELIARFEAATGQQVDLVLGSTGSLAAQIENGAPADLFFAADEATVARLRDQGQILPASVTSYASGRLVILMAEGSAAIGAVEELAREDVEVIAIANPELAPYGAAAVEVLRNAGILDAVQPRIVFGENIAQAYQLVRTGNADAALVARSMVADDPTADFAEVDPALHSPVVQSAGILARSTHPAAQPFLDFVTGPEGQGILARYGLEIAAVSR